MQMGRVGMEKGQSEAVKSLSQRLIDDHRKGNRELEALAKRKGVTLPPDDARMGYSMPLASKNGADFDREFARTAVEDHDKDIAAFEKEANSGQRLGCEELGETNAAHTARALVGGAGAAQTII